MVGDTETSLAKLRTLQAEHPFWNNRLFRAFTAGWLTLDDVRYVFSQYAHYSKNLTRFIGAVMANCENDLFRAQLSENLWEEGGGAAPEKRHAEIFRNFLRRGLDISDPNAIEFSEFTRYFVREYLVACLRATPVESSAFLSLGTEGIVARMYEIFVEGLHRVGIPDDLEFFYIHMQCDDGHAETLEKMMVSYASQPQWFETCAESLNHALNLRMQFFENLFEALQHRRIEGLLQRIQAKKSLAAERAQAVMEPGAGTRALPERDPPAQHPVLRRPPSEFGAEVLDPRTVRIPPGKNNEKHKHAHETLFYVISGVGQVLVDEAILPIKTGDCVFVPRWALHQTQNTGAADMVLLAVTDYGLTGKAFLGNYDKTARQGPEAKNDVPHEANGAGR